MSVRTIDDVTWALLMTGVYDLHARVRVTNGSGTYITLDGSYTEVDWTAPSPDQPLGGLNVTFLRETSSDDFTSSLAPLVQGSVFNRLDDGVTYSPLLMRGRGVTLEWAVTEQYGARPDPDSALWYEVFRGVIRKVDWPTRDTPHATIECYDLGGVLSRRKSEVAYTYAAGISYETALRQILDNNGFSWVALDVPVATAKVLEDTYAPGVQKNVWQQVQDMAQSLGWLSWFRYVGASALKLSLFAPERSKTEPDYTLPALYDFSQLELNEDMLGNVLFVVFTDQTGARRTLGPFEDDASIAQYGGPYEIRDAFWIVLDPTSPVRTTGAATDLATAALADVADQRLIASATVPPMPFVDISEDLYQLPADPRFFDEDQIVAPTGAQLRWVVDEEPSTVLALTGKPRAGVAIMRTAGDLTEEPVIYGITVEQPSADSVSVSVSMSENILWWQVWDCIGASPVTDGAPDDTYNKGEYNRQINTAAWGAAPGVHNVVVRAYAKRGTFVEATGSTEVAAPPEAVPITGEPADMVLLGGDVTEGMQDATATWTDTDTLHRVEVAWYRNGTYLHSDYVDANSGSTGVTESYPWLHTTLKVKARYTTGVPGAEGPWSDFSASLTLTGS